MAWIDLTEIPCYYINMDKDTKNAEQMNSMLKELGFKSITRIPGVKDDTETQPSGEKYLVGCGKAHINAMNAGYQNGMPFIVFEDDAEVNKQYWRSKIEIPDDPNPDAVYLGMSLAGKPDLKDIGNGWCKLKGMMGAHAILYRSEKFYMFMRGVAQFNVDYHIDWDIAGPIVQGHTDCHIICPHQPFFYQSDDRDNIHKWQFFTDRKIYNENHGGEKTWR